MHYFLAAFFFFAAVEISTTVEIWTCKEIYEKYEHVKKIKAFRLFQDFHPNDLALSRETKITWHLSVTTPKYVINR